VKGQIFQDLFVLELANNHWGKLERGLKIIDEFSQVAQFNNMRAAIKLQFRDVDTFIHKDHRHRDDVRYIKKTMATKMPWEHLKAMLDSTRGYGLLTMVTPFDEPSVEKCVEFNVDVLKIASSDIQDRFLIERIADARKPVIASTGGSSLKDVDDLVAFFERRNLPFALNHCVSIYPSQDSEIELNQIDFLRSRYPDIVIGFSTHECTDWQFSVMMAYAKGARTFERHIDIDYEDVPVSPYCTLPEQADVWFKAFKKAQEMCGPPGTAKRVPPEKEIKYLDELVRGVYAKRDLPAGHVLTDEDIYLAVPLQRGQLSCRELMRGEALSVAIARHAPIHFADIASRYPADSALRKVIDQRGIPPLASQPVRLRIVST
jgi:sialic acid synthase SpsE